MLALRGGVVIEGRVKKTASCINDKMANLREEIVKSTKKDQKQTKKIKNSPVRDLDAKANVKGGSLSNKLPPGASNHNEILI